MGLTVTDNAYWRAYWRSFPQMFQLGSPSGSLPQNRDSAVNKKWYQDAADTTLTYLGIYADADAIANAKEANKMSDSDFAAIKERFLSLGAITNPTNPELGATGVNNDRFFNGASGSGRTVKSLMEDYSIGDRVKHALFMSGPATSVLQALATDLVTGARATAGPQI